jgi:hypothetical protein
MTNIAKLIKFFAAIVLVSNATVAMAQEGMAPNGNYSSIGLSLSRTKYADAKCPYVECHDGYGSFGLNVSYQAIPNLIVGLDSDWGQSNGNTSTLKESLGGLYVGFVMGVGSSFDIGGMLRPVTKQYASCVGSLCVSNEESGTNVGVFGKWWVNDTKTFNIGLNLDSYRYANGSTNPNGATQYSSSALSVSYLLAGHHEFSLAGARTRDSALGSDVNTSSNLTYNYHF